MDQVLQTQLPKTEETENRKRLCRLNKTESVIKGLFTKEITVSDDSLVKSS